MEFSRKASRVKPLPDRLSQISTVDNYLPQFGPEQFYVIPTFVYTQLTDPAFIPSDMNGDGEISEGEGFIGTMPWQRVPRFDDEGNPVMGEVLRWVNINPNIAANLGNDEQTFAQNIATLTGLSKKLDIVQNASPQAFASSQADLVYDNTTPYRNNCSNTVGDPWIYINEGVDLFSIRVDVNFSGAPQADILSIHEQALINDVWTDMNAAYSATRTAFGFGNRVYVETKLISRFASGHRLKVTVTKGGASNLNIDRVEVQVKPSSYWFA